MLSVAVQWTIGSQHVSEAGWVAPRGNRGTGRKPLQTITAPSAVVSLALVRFLCFGYHLN